MLALRTMRIFAGKMLSPGLCAAFLIPFSFAGEYGKAAHTEIR
jgi:hypothetical protein